MANPILVLYITDTASSRRGVKGALERKHDQLEVTVADSGRDGLERLGRERARVDCVVSRYELPETDGLDLLRTVREKYPKLPFVLFTDRGSETVASDAISAGVSEYVRADGPSDPYAELADIIETEVSQYRTTRKSRHRLEELAASTTDCLWIFTREWDELLFISGYEEVWDRPVDRIEKNPRDFINGVHPEYREYVEQAMERISQGESIDIEYRILKGDGETGWVWAKGEPVFDDSGNVVRVVGFTRDVTERKERERRYETLIDNLPGVVYRAALEPEWPMQFVHGECEELTGYTADELHHQLDFGTDLIHLDDQESVYDTIRRAVERGESFELTYRIITKGGETRWVWERGREVDDGVIEGFFTDITARVTHKQELELRNQAIREAPVGVLITNPREEDNPIVYANSKLLEMTGYSNEEVLGRNCRFLQGPETRTEPVEEMREAIAETESVTVELRNYRKDGVMFWNRVSIAPVRDEQESLVNYIGFQEDVTERKQRQEQLKVLSRVLRHNLRNNQNAIRSWAEVIQSDVGPGVAEPVQRIIDRSDQLMTIAEKERVITEILTEKPRRRPIKLDRALRQAATAARGEFPDAEFTLDCPDGTTVTATTQIEAAIEELLTNAVIHNDVATPEARVAVTETADAVDITVTDNGPPIPEMEYPGLLSDKEETPVYHHGGLGLWFVNLVVSRSGATLRFEENEPRGNRVRLTFTT